VGFLKILQRRIYEAGINWDHSTDEASRHFSRDSIKGTVCQNNSDRTSFPYRDLEILQAHIDIQYMRRG
jgi:hypothetical protein